MLVRLAAHQFPWTPADPFSTPAAYEAPVIEDELQQGQPGAAAVQMTAVRRAGAHPRVEIFNHRAAAWRALQRVGHGGVDVVKLATHAGKQMVPALSECARRF